MRRYLITAPADLAHLGIPRYDDDSDSWDDPETTLCGLVWSDWSRDYFDVDEWAERNPEAICPTCDRKAMWQSIAAAEIR